MNFYPFHIGDYASATRHLSWDEDCAYRRLLDVYYTTEKPLPLDIKQVCRLAVASTKAQRDAVAVVLEEFFEKTDAGWINARADEEIDAMRIKQAAGEEKAAHEAGRMTRYRERRAAMFQALRAVDVVPAWDVPMKDLQRLHDQHCNAKGSAPATDLQREQAVSGDGPATAVPTPIPTPMLNSVPDGTDGGTPPAAPPVPVATEPKKRADPKSPEDMAKAELWRAAVSVLGQGDCPEPQARSFMGKLVQDFTFPIVQQAVAAAVTEQPADAREYLKATCQRLVGTRTAAGRKPSSHMGLTGRNYAEGVNVDGTFA